MAQDKIIWLVRNPASGSNDESAFEALQECCGAHGYNVDRVISFPDEPLVTREALEREGVATLAIFTGDGTLNAQIPKLYGWSGQVLVLPGGTMNLLSKRLHGDAELDAIISAAASGRAVARRPIIVRCLGGDGLSGILVGPATQWGEVREAMRDVDILEVASTTIDAIAESHWGKRVRCIDPRLGDADGYPMLVLSPREEGIVLRAYHADTVGELAQQWMALLQRNFREGPHDNFGAHEAIVLEAEGGAPLSLLIDGEPVTGDNRTRFFAARCEVDLLATRDA